MARRRRGAFPVVDLDEQSRVGQRSRTRATQSPSDEWNTSTCASLLSTSTRARLFEVPVVDVDRHGAMLERAVLRDEVLGTVEHVEGNLADFVDSRRLDRRGEARGGVIEGP